MSEPPVLRGKAQWQDPDIASAYAQAAHPLAQEWGYPAVFESLALARPEQSTLLDYGCGAGEAARWAARDFGVRVQAVDASAAMLEIARQYPSPGVAYRLAPDGRLPFLFPASVDACMCCFVLICMENTDALCSMAREIRRVLRPGGRLAVLGSDPDSIGTARYDGWHTAPGPYRDGEPVRSLLREPDGTTREITDTFWSTNAYRRVLATTGFRHTEVHRMPAADQPAGSGRLLLVTARAD